jgi:hypothetical protein
MFAKYRHVFLPRSACQNASLLGGAEWPRSVLCYLYREKTRAALTDVKNIGKPDRYI